MRGGLAVLITANVAYIAFCIGIPVSKGPLSLVALAIPLISLCFVLIVWDRKDSRAEWNRLAKICTYVMALCTTAAIVATAVGWPVSAAGAVGIVMVAVVAVAYRTKVRDQQKGSR